MISTVLIRKILLFILVAITINAQIESDRWTKREVSYTLSSVEHEPGHINNSSISSVIISSAQSAYNFLFSNYDGDNCPFYPSCSVFFVKAVKSENIFKGSLMFADRFTRDMNFLKGLNKYPLHVSGRFYDPPNNYSLNPGSITIVSQNEIINE